MSASLRTTHTDERRWAWHAIIALGLLILLEDMKRGMPTWLFRSIHGRTMSGISCHLRIWVTHMVRRCLAWHAIYPFDSAHGRTTSSVACYHGLWTEHMIERRQAWHSIIALGKHTRSNDVGHDMLSLHLERKHNRTTSGVACNHLPWTAHTVEWRWVWHAIIAFGLHTHLDSVGLWMTACSLGSIQGRTMSGLGCYHLPWTAYTNRRRRAWHVIIAHQLNTWSENVVCGMPPSVILRKMSFNPLNFEFSIILKKIIILYCYESDKIKKIILEYLGNIFENVNFNVR